MSSSAPRPVSVSSLRVLERIIERAERTVAAAPPAAGPTLG